MQVKEVELLHAVMHGARILPPQSSGSFRHLEVLTLQGKVSKERTPKSQQAISRAVPATNTDPLMRRVRPRAGFLSCH